MKTQDAINHFGSIRKLADKLGISTQAVYGWGDDVPEMTGYKLQVLTCGKLMQDEGLNNENV